MFQVFPYNESYWGHEQAKSFYSIFDIKDFFREDGYMSSLSLKHLDAYEKTSSLFACFCIKNPAHTSLDAYVSKI